MKIGVELEYWVTDSEGRLTSSQKIAEKVDFAEQEFVEPLIEIKTQPNKDVEKIKKEIVWKLKELISAAETLDQKIIPLGTPLNSKNITKIPSERGKIQEKIIGNNLEAAKRVAGMHIHFEKKDVKSQLNTLTALDPALALTSSSPYYQGEKIASSSRNQVYRNKCYQNFPAHGQLWNYVESVREWEEKISRAFDEFIGSAQELGIEKEQIKNNFQPENALWTPVRLRKVFPTVEWRALDVGRLEDTLRLVEEVKQIMEEDNDTSKPSFEEIKDLSEKAISDGIRNNDVRDYLKTNGFSVEKYNPITQEIDNAESLSLEKARKSRLDVAEEFRDSVKSC